MNHSERMVRFMCPECDQRLKRPARDAGRACRCTRCSTRMKVPGQLRALAVRPVVHPVTERYPVVLPARQEQAECYPFVLPVRQERATVPFKVALPKSLGGVETTVSQGTANSMAKVVTGGFLVVLGVFVAGMFGIRVPKA